MVIKVIVILELYSTFHSAEEFSYSLYYFIYLLNKYLKKTQIFVDHLAIFQSLCTMLKDIMVDKTGFYKSYSLVGDININQIIIEVNI